MGKPDTKSQIKSGLRLAALIILFLFVAGLFLVGVGDVFFARGQSRILGCIFLVVSVTVMVLEMNRWVRALPGILSLAVLNSLITLSTGHLLANPTVSVSRAEALILTLFFACCAVLSRKLVARRLKSVDRLALLAFVFIFALLLQYNSTGVMPGGRTGALRPLDFVVMASGICSLLVPWVYDRMQHRRKPSHYMPPDRDAVKLS